ncbi:PREDICTED: DNA repair protein recA homolog 2, mitochondrial-like isoform X1 [Nicotiana attenuata]|uniref:Dna repair protein reca -like 2, mitochondrial n=2 Tax=Nicotiana attenuata TaxID=49451 RepID=A0A314LF46_NICAT|nr:PREDICTED: DNA repair protein recA homolog 2, mitochondrial-like isoform X1 [Nicotiana attenuata]OIT40380.1 dna repair protein reca -like 2, mitochondrial [Nicotiana attenuata]
MVPHSLQFLRLIPSSIRRLSIFPYKPQNGIAWTRMLSTDASWAEGEFDDIQDDTKTSEKATALRSALSQLVGDFGKESMLSLQRFFGARRRAPVVPTGSLRLDLALGIGGLPKGRIVEIYGQEASGKTTLALHVIKEAQKLGGYCAYLDVENGMNPSLAEAIGVNVENLLISQPDSAENLLSIVDTLTKSGSMDVIVVDSVAALVPRLELDATLGDSPKGLQSKIMTQALRKIHYSLCNSSTLIIFVNQVRSNKGLARGSGRMEEVTCGGNALPFYAAVRLRTIRKQLLKTSDKITGLGICVKVVKNKLAPAATEAELRIQFGGGFCIKSEVLELACEHEVILKEGGSYFIDGEVLNSRQDAEDYLAANGAVLAKIVDTLRDQLFVNKMVKITD